MVVTETEYSYIGSEYKLKTPLSVMSLMEMSGLCLQSGIEWSGKYDYLKMRSCVLSSALYHLVNS